MISQLLFSGEYIFLIKLRAYAQTVNMFENITRLSTNLLITLNFIQLSENAELSNHLKIIKSTFNFILTNF